MQRISTYVKQPRMLILSVMKKTWFAAFFRTGCRSSFLPEVSKPCLFFMLSCLPHAKEILPAGEQGTDGDVFHGH